MGEVIITRSVHTKMDVLVDRLHSSKYFGNRKDAKSYVDALHSFMNSIATQRHRPTINPKYGAWYCEFKPNRHTSWFVTFDKKEERYIVRNLINNHTKDYPAFIKAL